FIGGPLPGDAAHRAMPRREMGYAFLAGGGSIGIVEFSLRGRANGSSHGEHKCELCHHLHDHHHRDVPRPRSMKILVQRIGSRARASKGFTLAELMVTMAILGLVVTGIL